MKKRTIYYIHNVILKKIHAGRVMLLAMIQRYRFAVEAPNIIGCIEES